MERLAMENKVKEIFSGYLMQEGSSFEDAYFETIRALGRHALLEEIPSTFNEEERKLVQTAFGIQMHLMWISAWAKANPSDETTVFPDSVTFEKSEAEKIASISDDLCALLEFLAEHQEKIVDDKTREQLTKEICLQKKEDLQKLIGRLRVVIDGLTPEEAVKATPPRFIVDLYDFAGIFLKALFGDKKSRTFSKEFNDFIRILNEMCGRYQQSFNAFDIGNGSKSN